jgi:hypothetical protein
MNFLRLSERAQRSQAAYQADLLASHFDRVIVMLDGDEAGRQGVAGVVGALAGRLTVTAIALTDGVQPDRLGSDEIRRLLIANVCEDGVDSCDHPHGRRLVRRPSKEM